MSRILVVEDEQHLADGLRYNLEAEQHDVDLVDNGEEAVTRLIAEPNRYDLVVLDLMLPGRSGLEILQTLRQRLIDTPVLILTARDGVDDQHQIGVEHDQGVSGQGSGPEGAQLLDPVLAAGQVIAVENARAITLQVGRPAATHGGDDRAVGRRVLPEAAIPTPVHGDHQAVDGVVVLRACPGARARRTAGAHPDIVLGVLPLASWQV